MNVRRIDPKLAQAVSVENHYLHRKCPCTVAYGLFDGGRITGIIIYGSPASSTLKNGICGKEEAPHVLELKRLWAEDTCPKNTESWFIAQTFRLLKTDCPDLDILVSYADSGYNHRGIVYQATNWIYTGTSAPFKDIVLKGDSRDHLTQRDELKAKYGSMKNAIAAIGGGTSSTGNVRSSTATFSLTEISAETVI